MKIVVLSDHPNHSAKKLQMARQLEHQKDMEKYSTEVHEQKLEVSRAQKEYDNASGLNAVGKWFVLAGKKINSAINSPDQPELRPPSEDEQRFRAGARGESRVEEALGERLSDEWTLIKGYANSKGELDLLLLGPARLCAFEVKYRNGTISCNRDHWWLDKFDNYGNKVEKEKKILDKKGRSASCQINQIADQLQKFLNSRSISENIYRAIVFSHEKSKIGSIADLTVDKVLTLQDIPKFISDAVQNKHLEQSSVEKILALVRQDHEHHRRNRKRNT